MPDDAVQSANVCGRANVCNACRETAEDKARQYGKLVEYAEAVRKVQRLLRAAYSL